MFRGVRIKGAQALSGALKPPGACAKWGAPDGKLGVSGQGGEKKLGRPLRRAVRRPDYLHDYRLMGGLAGETLVPGSRCATILYIHYRFYRAKVKFRA